MAQADLNPDRFPVTENMQLYDVADRVPKVRFFDCSKHKERFLPV
jgi:hypothetical protein